MPTDLAKRLRTNSDAATSAAAVVVVAVVVMLALVLYMRCHQIGKCYRDKTVTVAATRYVAAVACSCSSSCACISGKAAALAAEPLH